MITALFQRVLLLSLAGGLLSLFLLTLRPVTRKLFSPNWQYYIWLAVLFVLVLPVSFSLPHPEPEMLTAGQMPPQPLQEATLPETNTETTPLPDRLPIRSLPLPQDLPFYAGLVWICGIAWLLCWRLLRYLLFIRTLRKQAVGERFFPGTPKRLKIRQTDMLDAPLLVGLLHPVLYLPSIPLSEKEWQYILLHELTHYKRRDLLYKWAAMLVASVHWFNPLVHIAAKQIDLECEVSCDFLVTNHLSKQGKKEYMNLILNMLDAVTCRPRALTTQMASSKHLLKRRFTMIQTKKAPTPLVSFLSVAIAVVLLSTSVLASGVLSGLAEERYTVALVSKGEVMALTGKPLIENGEVYVPLRETFEKLGFLSSAESYMDWSNGRIQFCLVANDRGTTFRSVWAVEIGRNALILNAFDDTPPETTASFANAPILRENLAYIPYSYFLYLIHAATTEEWPVGYIVCDKDGTVIEAVSQAGGVAGPEKISIASVPSEAVSQFFRRFEQSDFDGMKPYCTQACVSRFFGDGFVFGMTKAALTDLQIDRQEYTKSSNDFVVHVSVDMTPHESSVFSPCQTATSFYLILQRQPDGQYLIDEFATG